jgi:hypothetical protein
LAPLGPSLVVPCAVSIGNSTCNRLRHSLADWCLSRAGERRWCFKSAVKTKTRTQDFGTFHRLGTSQVTMTCAPQVSNPLLCHAVPCGPVSAGRGAVIREAEEELGLTGLQGADVRFLFTAVTQAEGETAAHGHFRDNEFAHVFVAPAPELGSSLLLPLRRNGPLWRGARRRRAEPALRRGGRRAEPRRYRSLRGRARADRGHARGACGAAPRAPCGGRGRHVATCVGRAERRLWLWLPGLWECGRGGPARSASAFVRRSPGGASP